MTRHSRAELVALIERFLQISATTEAHDEALYHELHQAFLDPQIMDYLFYPDRPMTTEEVVDRALTYRPIVADWSD